jgi:hypothetical protein
MAAMHTTHWLPDSSAVVLVVAVVHEVAVVVELLVIELDDIGFELRHFLQLWLRAKFSSPQEHTQSPGF